MRVTPRGGRDAIGGGREGRIVTRLAAAPVDGKANAALVSLIADAFVVPKRAVSIISGETGRVKRLRIAGDAAALAEIARTLYAAAP
ncbi:DUF167 domain-containing protein [Sphingomonas sp. BT553]|uniref:UPF0235 protein JAO74_12515 n=1 Tax=Sphingomonas mollis TaxID=2795726 RepID=A0ABS0XS87_9SPHN|nr:DUF167 domain-containing protein [Sphingomonas sp. BT553]